FGDERPDRRVGIGLNMYVVLSVERRRRRGGRRGKAEAEVVSEAWEDWSPERHRVISGEQVVELLPALAGREPTSGYLFYDCQTDDVRLVFTVLGEAERFGAVMCNRVEVTDLVGEGVRAVDGESGSSFVIRAGSVVNATGVWA